MRKLTACLTLLLALSACYSDEDTVDGRWIGTISEEARRELRIEGAFEDDLFVVEFEPSAVRLNDTVRDAEYASNQGRTLVKFTNENRVLTVHHDENDDTRIKLTAVSYFRTKIFEFELQRDSD